MTILILALIGCAMMVSPHRDGWSTPNIGFCVATLAFILSIYLQ